MGCQIRRQAEHGATHNLAAFLEATELIPRLAAANVQTILKSKPPFWLPHATRTRARRQTDKVAIGNGLPPNAHVPPPVLFEATPPGATLGPPVKPGPVFVASGGVIKEFRVRREVNLDLAWLPELPWSLWL